MKLNALSSELEGKGVNAGESGNLEMYRPFPLVPEMWNEIPFHLIQHCPKKEQ